MDNAVALVQAYLHVNGYFTVCEFPVLEAAVDGGYRTVTDLDVLAFRFPHAGRLVAGLPAAPNATKAHFESDPVLGVPTEDGDMIIGEVKEGRARLNESATSPNVLETALIRFGCCREEEAAGMVRTVLEGQPTRGSHGHWVRLVAFASIAESVSLEGVLVVPLGHVLRFLQDHIERNWEALHSTESKHQVFGFLMTLQKAMRGFAEQEESKP